MSRGKKIFLTLLAVALVGGIFLARPGYRQLREWRADKLAAAAEAAIAREDWAEASQKAQAAYQLAPMNARTMRAVARLYSLAGQPSAVTFWENLRASGQATMEDRRELVRAGLRFGKAPMVRDEALRLANAQPVEAANLR